MKRGIVTLLAAPIFLYASNIDILKVKGAAYSSLDKSSYEILNKAVS